MGRGGSREKTRRGYTPHIIKGRGEGCYEIGLERRELPGLKRTHTCTSEERRITPLSEQGVLEGRRRGKCLASEQELGKLPLSRQSMEARGNLLRARKERNGGKILLLLSRKLGYPTPKKKKRKKVKDVCDTA